MNTEDAVQDAINRASNSPKVNTAVPPSRFGGSNSSLLGDLDTFLDRGDRGGNNPFKGSWDSSNDPLMKLLLQMKYFADDDTDANLSLLQLLFQYLVGEQNYARNFANSELAYDRSKAANQVNLMMQAGMSRAAALRAIQQGGAYTAPSSDTAVSPFQSDVEGHRAQKYQNLLNTIDTASRLANQIAALSSLPYDIQSKRLTNDLMQNQLDMLEMQKQGMQDAAMFAQAVANADAVNKGFKVADLPINEQYAYFQKQSKMQPADSGFEPSAFFYGNSSSFARAASNPFFWASYSDTVRNRNAASASIFEPERAAQEVSHLRAATFLNQNQAFNEQMRSRILRVDGYLAEANMQARKDLETLKIECEKNGLKFDNERAKAFLDRVQSFTQLDFLNLDYEINRLSELGDPIIFQKQKDALVKTLDFQVANYIYMHSLASFKNGVLSSELANNEEDVYRWTKNYLRYNELGQSASVNAGTSIARTVFTGLTTAAAGIFAGAKVWDLVGKSRAAASAAASAAQAGNPPLPFNSVVPLVAVPATQQFLTPNYGVDSFNGMQ